MGKISISMNDSTTEGAKKVASFLHRHMKLKHASILKSLKDQGKVARCLESCSLISTKIGHLMVLVYGFVTGDLSIARGQTPYQQMMSRAVGRTLVLSAEDATAKT